MKEADDKSVKEDNRGEEKEFASNGRIAIDARISCL
jgi:hypothetical protein